MMMSPRHTSGPIWCYDCVRKLSECCYSGVLKCATIVLYLVCVCVRVVCVHVRPILSYICEKFALIEILGPVFQRCYIRVNMVSPHHTLGLSPQ
jgi:hypothetical protein